MADQKSFRHEILERMTALATTAFGLVAALAWNDAVQELFKAFFPAGNTLGAKFGYAVLVSLLIILVTWQLGRLAERLEPKS